MPREIDNLRAQYEESKQHTTTQRFAEGHVKIRHNLVLSIYLAITRKESLCGRKKILKSDFLKIEKRIAPRFPFIRMVDVAGFQETAKRLRQGIYSVMP